MITVVEKFVRSKDPSRQSEDVVVVTDDFVAVIDGATDEGSMLYSGRKGGRFAAEMLAGVIEGLSATISPINFAEALTDGLASAVQRVAPDQSAISRWPSASVVCLSRTARQVWRIGDCHAVIGDEEHISRKRVDEAAYGFRAAVNAALLEIGTPLEEILQTDPGSVAARPLFDVQQHLANRPGPWSYGCIDGRAVPHDLIEVFDVGNADCRVVLASDGYTDVRSTLSETELLLAKQQAADPAAIGQLWSMGKSLRPGNVTMDDCAYVRVVLAAELS